MWGTDGFNHYTDSQTNTIVSDSTFIYVGGTTNGAGFCWSDCTDPNAAIQKFDIASAAIIWFMTYDVPTPNNEATVYGLALGSSSNLAVYVIDRVETL